LSQSENFYNKARCSVIDMFKIL